MKHFIIVLITLFIGNVSVAQKQMVVDPNAEARTVNGNFTHIKISGGMDVILSQGNDQGIAVSASEERYKAGIKTVVENNILRVYYDGDKSFSRNRRLKVYISFVNLTELDVSGACDVLIAGKLTGNSLLLKLSGASNLQADVQLSSLSMILSGASDLNINGTAGTVNIESSGASDVKGYRLTTDLCTVKATGASDINITVNKEISASASGASEISYRGSAVLRESNKTGASSIQRKGR